MSGTSGFRQRSRLVALAALAALSGCAATVTGEAVTGEPPAAFYPIEADSLSMRLEFEQTVEEVNDYWTEDRKKGAAPIDPGTPGDMGLIGSDRATGVIVAPTTAEPSAARQRVAATDDGDPADAVSSAPHGRLYMVFEGGDGVCSATVVSSESRNVVVTAAHCVWDTATGEAASNLFFIPEDENWGQERPYGMWVPTAVHMSNTFSEEAHSSEALGIYGEGWAYDFAFLEMAPDEDGRNIEEVTGGQGIAFGVPVEDLVVLGYPSAEPFDGSTQRYCAADRWEPIVHAYAIPCAMTPGASGGAWLAGFDARTRTGYVVGTSSFSNGFELGAAPLGAVALSLYSEVGQQ